MPVANGSLKLDSQTIEHKGSPKGAKGSGFNRQGPSNQQTVPPKLLTATRQAYAIPRHLLK